MSAGPVSRAAGGLGLAALIPTSYQLATGTLGPLDAALRAGATFVAVLMVGRIVRWWLTGVAASFERAGTDQPDPAVEAPRRRQGDGRPDEIPVGASTGPPPPNGDAP